MGVLCRQIVAAAIVSFASVVLAQGERPTFAGDWVLAPEASTPNEIPFCGLECTIVQDSSWITFTPSGAGRNTDSSGQRYKLDGTPTRRSTKVLGRDAVYVDTATWSDSILALETTRVSDPPGQPVRHRLFLEDGRLIVERSFSSSSLGRRGGASRPARLVYRRKR